MRRAGAVLFAAAVALVAAPSAGARAGAMIAALVANRPAACAGLTAGDVIAAIDGHTIASPQALTSRLLKEKPGATVTIS